jgi:3-oxoacyl-[acyl-carrier protein] reductase
MVALAERWHEGPQSVKHPVAVVTGAAGGLGAAVAACLAARGDRVVLVGRDLAALERTAAAAGGTTGSIVGDLRETSTCTRVIAETVERWGRVDILVNAAAILRRQELSEIDDESVAEVFDTNFRAVLWLCRAALTDMERRRWGRIVNVTSVGVHTGGYRPTSALYEASKAAVANLTKTLARYGAERGVLINSVAAGAMRTPMLTDETPPEVLAEIEADIPLGRLADPGEVAQAIAFLSSERNTYATGACFDLNGGLAMP